MKINIILATDEKNWIWKSGTLAWHISSDMKYFKKITSQTTDLAKHNAVVMWRKTRESIPSHFRPLDNRINCILTKNIKYDDIGSKIDDFVLYFNSLERCLSELESKQNIENIFIIWWASIYNQVLQMDMLDKIYVTKIKWDFNCDVFFDGVPDNFQVESYTDGDNENGIDYSFWIYKKID